jgi:hypothetical protein
MILLVCASYIGEKVAVKKLLVLLFISLNLVTANSASAQTDTFFRPYTLRCITGTGTQVLLSSLRVKAKSLGLTFVSFRLKRLAFSTTLKDLVTPDTLFTLFNYSLTQNADGTLALAHPTSSLSHPCEVAYQILSSYTVGEQRVHNQDLGTFTISGTYF